jgi:LPS-assembly lipoprotein
LIADAQFKLVRIADGVTIIDSKAQAFATYDRTPQRFADERAARDAELRVARSLANEITPRVGAAIAESTPSP